MDRIIIQTISTHLAMRYNVICEKEPKYQQKHSSMGVDSLWGVCFVGFCFFLDGDINDDNDG